MSSTLDGNLEGGVLSGGVIVDLNPQSTGSSSGIIAHEWLLGCRISLRTDTLKLSQDYIRTPSGIWVGKVLDFGHIERSISAPAGPPRVGDCLIDVDDRTLELRRLLHAQTGLRRLIEIFRISDEQLVGGFEITDITFGPTRVQFRGTDITAKWMDRPIAMLGTRENFPWMAPGVNEFFMPIIVGSMFSSVGNLQGVIRCPRMGPVTLVSSPAVTVDRYCIARHRIWNGLANDAIIVYRKLRTDAAFSIVGSSQYTITMTEPFTANGQTYTPSYLDFLSPQAADAEIRVDTFGALQIPGIGGLPSYTWYPEQVRYPIDALSLVLFEMTASVGGDSRAERYNSSSLLDVRQYCVDNNIYFDGAVTEQITPGVFLSRLQTSFEFDFYVNRHYQCEVRMLAGEDTGRPVLSDTFDYMGMTPQYAQAPANRFNYRHGWNPSTGQFRTAATYDNVADQIELGNVEYQGNTDQIEAEQVDLFYVSDPSTALVTILRRSAFKSLGSHRCTFTVSTPEWFEALELGMLIGITHYGGIHDGGWVNEEFKVLSIRHDLNRLQTTVEAVRHTPVAYGDYWAWDTAIWDQSRWA